MSKHYVSDLSALQLLIEKDSLEIKEPVEVEPVELEPINEPVDRYPPVKNSLPRLKTLVESHLLQGYSTGWVRGNDKEWSETSTARIGTIILSIIDEIDRAIEGEILPFPSVLSSIRFIEGVLSQRDKRFSISDLTIHNELTFLCGRMQLFLFENGAVQKGDKVIVNGVEFKGVEGTIDLIQDFTVYVRSTEFGLISVQMRDANKIIVKA